VPAWDEEQVCGVGEATASASLGASGHVPILGRCARKLRGGVARENADIRAARDALSSIIARSSRVMKMACRH
jgi:hypothetical protein